MAYIYPAPRTIKRLRQLSIDNEYDDQPSPARIAGIIALIVIAIIIAIAAGGGTTRDTTVVTR